MVQPAGSPVSAVWIQANFQLSNIGADLRDGLRGAEREAESGGRGIGDRLGSGISTALKAATVGIAAITAGVGAAAVGGLSVLKTGIEQASDFNEVQTAIGATFGSAQDAVLEFSKAGALALGQSRNQILDAAQSFGIFGKAAGLSGEENAEFAKTFVQLSTDMASFYNASPEEAAEALSAGFRGEAEPLRKYGVLLDDATLRTEALKQGLISSTKEALTPANKVLAARGVILAQTSLAQGDFARTSSGMANQLRIARAQWTDLTATLGKAFLPAVVAVLGVLTGQILPSLTDKVAGFAEAISPKIISLSESLAEALQGGELFGGVGDLFKDIVTRIKDVISFVGQAYSAVAPLLQALYYDGIQPLIQSLLSTLGPVLHELATTLAPLIGQLTTTLLPIITQVISALGPVLAQIAGTLAEQISTVVIALAGALSSLAPVFAGLLTQLAPILNAVLEVLGPVLTRLVTALAPVLTTVAQVLSDAFAELGPVIGEGLVQMIEALSGVFTALMPAIQRMLPALTSVFSALIPVLTGIITSLVPVIVQIVQTLAPLVGQILTAFAPLITQLASQLVPVIGQLLQTLAPAIGQLVAILAPAITQIVQLLLPVLTQVLTTLIPVVAEVLSAFAPVITELIGVLMPLLTTVLAQLMPVVTDILRELMPPILNLIKELAPAITSLLEVLAPAVVEIGRALTTVLEPVLKVVGELIETLMPLVSGFINIVTDSLAPLMDIIGSIITTVARMATAVAEALKKALGPFQNFGKSGASIMKGFIDGFTGGIQKLLTTVRDTMRKVRDYFPNSPAKTGPFSGSGWVDSSGAAVADAFAGGFTSNGATITAAVDSTLSDAQRRIDGMVLTAPAVAAGTGTVPVPEGVANGVNGFGNGAPLLNIENLGGVGVSIDDLTDQIIDKILFEMRKA